ncbi:uncharacterized protein LOC129811434 [Salvelinus fontinalis]|uniref:uncharacterized protein LOC129811434 n=1 Tax=Salvelinus fontinalis TaxID=8038 RepID=UPI0024858992|nr:uncharacterized protein LOC129811434 [Salvelinus fontinalis]
MGINIKDWTSEECVFRGHSKLQYNCNKNIYLSFTKVLVRVIFEVIFHDRTWRAWPGVTGTGTFLADDGFFGQSDKQGWPPNYNKEKKTVPEPGPEGHLPVIPGDLVYVRVFRRKWDQPRREGPYEVAAATKTAVQVKGSKTWYHLNHCTRVPTEKRIQPHRDENTEDADTPGGSPEGAGAEETIETPGRSQENGRPDTSQDTTSASTKALRRSTRGKKSEQEREKQPKLPQVWSESPEMGGSNMPVAPDDIPAVADLFDRSPPQWDPEVPPAEWEHLFPEIDTLPDESPVRPEEGASGEERGREASREREGDFPTIDFSTLEGSP